MKNAYDPAKNIEPADHNQITLNVAAREALLYNLATKTKAEIDALSYTLYDLIISCTYEDIECSEDQWLSIIHPSFGKCYIFNNFQQNKSIAKRPGKDGGLELEINVLPETYISTTSLVGVRVTLETSGLYPFPDLQGVKISPGFSYEYTLQYKSIRKLRKPYGNCAESNITGIQNYSFYHGLYSPIGCDLTSMQEITNQICNCCNPVYAKPKYCQICNVTDTCHRAVELEFADYKPDCPIACFEEHYNFVNTVSFPIFPPDSPKKSLLRLAIFYQQLNLVEMSEVPAMTITDLVSSIGSCMGLLLGMSVVSILEVCFFVTDLMIHVVHKLIIGKQNQSIKPNPACLI